MIKQLKQFWNEEDGATAIEYGLIAGLVAIVIVAGLTTLGTDLSTMFTNIGAAVTAHSPDATGAAPD
jgi:pilus assembly protein Flp/PilA